MKPEIFHPDNSEYCTGNTTLFKIHIKGSDPYFRLVPVQKEEEIEHHLNAVGAVYYMVRANGSEVLRDLANDLEGVEIRGDELFDSDEVWKPISSWPILPKIHKEKPGKMMLRNEEKACYGSNCMGCGEPNIKRVAYCYIDKRTYRFCNEDCEELYIKYLQRKNWDADSGEGLRPQLRRY